MLWIFSALEFGLATALADCVRARAERFDIHTELHSGPDSAVPSLSATGLPARRQNEYSNPISGVTLSRTP
jgi:hypothetical protein